MKPAGASNEEGELHRTKTPTGGGWQISGPVDIILKDHCRRLDGERAPQTQGCGEVVRGAPNGQENQGTLPKVVQVICLTTLKLPKITDVGVQGQKDKGQLGDEASAKAQDLHPCAAGLELGLEVKAKNKEGQELLDAIAQGQQPDGLHLMGAHQLRKGPGLDRFVILLLAQNLTKFAHRDSGGLAEGHQSRDINIAKWF